MIDRNGQRLGNYRLSGLLGRGGFAEVYLGEHIYLKTQAAVKILQAHLLKTEDQEDFLKEAQTIVRLTHPHIVRIFDFGVDGETPYLAMDYAPGGTLRQRHRRGERLELATVVEYVRQVAEALQHIHNERLIHRDIKPENMLVGKQNEILLGDFGIALVVQSSRYQSTQDVVGTVAYMSPEQIQGQPRPASDQYSLAIVVYEWLCGERPFYGSFTELCTQHMFAPVPSLRAKVSSITPEVEDVIITALAKDPKERFESIREFAKTLEQARKIRSVISPLPTPKTSVSPGTSSPATPPLDQQTISTPYHAISSTQATKPAHSPISLTIASPKSTSHGVSRRSLLTAGGIGLGTVAIGWALSTLSPHISNSINLSLTPTSSPQQKNLLNRYQGFSSTSPLFALRWSPDSTRLQATDKKTIQVWDAFDGKQTATYHISDNNSILLDIAWTKSGPCLALTDYGTTNLIHIIDVTTGQEISIYSLQKNTYGFEAAGAIAWSPDATRIVTATTSAVVHVWNPMNSQTISTFTPSTSPGQTLILDQVAWSPDSTRIATWGSTGNNGIIFILDATTGRQISVFAKHTTELQQGNNATSFLLDYLAWDPSSRFIVSVAQSNSSMQSVIRVWDTNNGSQIYTETEATNIVSEISWSPQSSLIATSFSDTFRIWNSNNGQAILTQQSSGGYLVFDWSPDGKRMASNTQGGPPGPLKVWDATTGAHAVSYIDRNNQTLPEAVESIGWSPDGKHIVTINQDQTIDVWQV